MKTFLRWLGSVAALVPMMVGLVVGLVGRSFALGYAAGAEVIDDHLDWVNRKRKERADGQGG